MPCGGGELSLDQNKRVSGGHRVTAASVPPLGPAAARPPPTCLYDFPRVNIYVRSRESGLGARLKIHL